MSWTKQSVPSLSIYTKWLLDKSNSRCLEQICWSLESSRYWEVTVYIQRLKTTLGLMSHVTIITRIVPNPLCGFCGPKFTPFCIPKKCYFPAKFLVSLIIFFEHGLYIPQSPYAITGTRSVLFRAWNTLGDFDVTNFLFILK